MQGIELARTTHGPIEYRHLGTGRTVLVLHGGHDSCRADIRGEALLDHGFSLLIPTRPGYQGTPLFTGPTPMAAATALIALLDHLEIEQVSLIGISAGGPTALELARRYPDRVDRLVLEAAVSRPWVTPASPLFYLSSLLFNPLLQSPVWAMGRHAFRRDRDRSILLLLPQLTRRDPRQVLARLDEEDRDYIARLVENMESGSGFMADMSHRAPELDEIRVPTLIMHSPHDGAVPFSHARFAARHILGAELYSTETDTHLIWIGPGSRRVLERRAEFLARRRR